MRRVFAEDVPWRSCDGGPNVVAFVAEPSLARSLLATLGLPAEPATFTPARDPPQAKFAWRDPRKHCRRQPQVRRHGHLCSCTANCSRPHARAALAPKAATLLSRVVSNGHQRNATCSCLPLRRQLHELGAGRVVASARSSPSTCGAGSRPARRAGVRGAQPRGGRGRGELARGRRRGPLARRRSSYAVGKELGGPRSQRSSSRHRTAAPCRRARCHHRRGRRLPSSPASTSRFGRRGCRARGAPAHRQRRLAVVSGSARKCFLRRSYEDRSTDSTRTAAWALARCAQRCWHRSALVPWLLMDRGHRRGERSVVEDRTALSKRVESVHAHCRCSVGDPKLLVRRRP